MTINKGAKQMKKKTLAAAVCGAILVGVMSSVSADTESLKTAAKNGIYLGSDYCDLHSGNDLATAYYLGRDEADGQYKIIACRMTGSSKNDGVFRSGPYGKGSSLINPATAIDNANYIVESQVLTEDQAALFGMTGSISFVDGTNTTVIKTTIATTGKTEYSINVSDDVIKGAVQDDLDTKADKSDVDSKITAEETARKDADDALSQKITDEATSRKDADDALSQKITDEATARKNADDDLSQKITDEATTRKNADDDLAKKLAEERNDRIWADKSQDKVIEQVNQNMVDGFTAINKNMADGFNALSAVDAQERAEREAADAKLQQNLDSAYRSLSNDIGKVGAGAAALAALHPQDFDPDDKLSFAAGYGHYRSANATALGVYYQPNEDTTFSFAGTIGNGDAMLNAGVSFRLGRGGKNTLSRTALTQQVKKDREVIANMSNHISEMESNMHALLARLALVEQELAEKDKAENAQ